MRSLSSRIVRACQRVVASGVGPSTKIGRSRTRQYSTNSVSLKNLVVDGPAIKADQRAERRVHVARAQATETGAPPAWVWLCTQARLTGAPEARNPQLVRRSSSIAAPRCVRLKRAG